VCVVDFWVFFSAMEAKKYSYAPRSSIGNYIGCDRSFPLKVSLFESRKTYLLEKTENED
jgi:hypothetical protein